MNKENFCVVVESDALYEPCHYFANKAEMEAFKELAQEADFYVSEMKPDVCTTATDAYESLQSIYQMCIEE